MGKSLELDLNEPPVEYGCAISVMLEKDHKPICRAKCPYLPCEVPSLWTICEIRPLAKYGRLEYPHCCLYPEPENSHQTKEWGTFLNFLRKYNMAALVKSESCDFYICASDGEKGFDHAVLLYKIKKHNVQDQEPRRSDPCQQNPVVEAPNKFQPVAAQKDPCQQNPVVEAPNKFQPVAAQKGHSLHKSFVRTDPSYLVTLSQAHSGWIFGAIAELIDNARDANASRLDISIELLYSRIMGQKIPVLSVVDNGDGMCHEEVIRMLSFGHKQTDVYDIDRIGQFGIGFKTGAMRLGRDAVILTQTSSSRSVALLSQSFNENKENLEIPIITYSKQGNYMDLDLGVQSQASADSHLQAIKDFSPFNEYVIGQKIGMFGEDGTGTQIYIWNLDQWGSDYSLQWNKEDMSGQRSPGDILIRSRRIRSRPGQISQKVPLDYSLQAYLEVIFLDPRMKIYVQGSLVKSRPLAKSLNKTVVVKGEIMGNPIQLTLGRSQVEWDCMNCGIFLYWRGRLIEAYKRVGGMVHNADMGRGVLGVVDVTNIMRDRNGRVLVLNNKQGFQDCEAYAKLEEWLGSRSDEYWDDNFDTLHLKQANANCKPDQEWVQCNKCRKWRALRHDFDSESLPSEWFCYMPPFIGSCEIPEQQVARGVITVSARRSGCDSQINKFEVAAHEEENCVEEKHQQSKQSMNDSQQKHVRSEASRKVKSSLIKKDLKSHGCHASQSCRSGGVSSRVKSKSDCMDDSDGDSTQTVEEVPQQPVLKRLRRGPARSCKKS